MPGGPLPGVGFECPECGRKRCCRLRCRNVFQCTRCRHQVSLTAGTVFANTKLPLTRWFLAMYLLTQSIRMRGAGELLVVDAQRKPHS